MSDIRIVEVPFELGAGTVGASLGIEALKAAAINRKSNIFLRHKAVHQDVGFNFLEQDVEHAWAKYISRIRDVITKTANTVSQVLEDGNFPVVLAGDHSTAAGSIAGVLQAYPNDRIGVIWIDAHGDLHTPYTSPSGNLHGMTLAIASGLDNTEVKRRDIKPETSGQWQKLKGTMPDNRLSLDDVMFIGVREVEPEEEHIMNKHNIPRLSVNEFKENPYWVKEQVEDHFKDCDRIYISFDVDSMDPTVSSGTGTPVPGGLSVEDAIALNVMLLKISKVCCWEMVEINPLLDERNKMAEAGVSILERVLLTLSDR